MGSFGAAHACSGGGEIFKSWVGEVFTVKNAYVVGSAAIDSGAHFGVSVVGQGLGIINGMLFTMANFFSEQENVDDFTAGRSYFEDLSEANKAVDSRITGGGAMGKPASMSIEEYESYFK